MSAHKRFSAADWYQPQTITVGGVGGVGSWLCLQLAKCGHKLIMYDNDTIEELNIGGQLYGRSEIGLNKSLAMNNLCRNLGMNSTCYYYEEFEENSYVTDICFATFDSIPARKLMFEQWKKVENKKIFMDARMIAECSETYFVTPDRIEQYEETLFSEEENQTANLNCSYKATNFCATMTSSQLVAGFHNWLANYLTQDDLREVPFKMENNLLLLTYDKIM